MKDWFIGLESRERAALIFGAAALLLFLFYVAVWQPVFGGIDKLETTVREQRDSIQWMQNAAGEVRLLQRTSQRGGKNLGGRSLLAVVDQSARKVGLGPELKRVEPEGSDAVRVWLESAPFDNLILWLGELSSEQGVRVRAITVEGEDVHGRVKSRVTLMEPPGER